MLSLDNYDYHLPKELIATTPATTRDSSRLFVYNTKSDEVAFDVFRNISKYLPKPILLVMNNTKVVPARLWLSKTTGGKIEVLLMMNEFRLGDELLKGVVDRKILIGAKLHFNNGEYLEVVRQEEQFFHFRPSFSLETSEIWSYLTKEGVTPIPPYIKGNTMTETRLRAKYQSVLAKHPASVAAPTASLHFTERLLARLEAEHIKRSEVTLHVGAGTFAPIDENNFKTKKLFTEYYDIDDRAQHDINTALSDGVPVIPVGTTAMRTLESAAKTNSSASKPGPWTIAAGARETNIFIYPPYRFKIADGLITNFHVPRSSLLLLVDAFLKDKKSKRDILALYEIAIREKFRFYSFGDAMLII